MAKMQIELIIPGEYKEEPIFFHIIKHYNVIPNIIEASFSTEQGWAIVDFEGDQEELDRLLLFLKEKGVQVNFR